MGRAPCCSKVGLHRGPWSPKEDAVLTNYVQAHGEGNWRSLPKNAGLLRCGKSCRLRWMNYLRPDIKRGNITPDEDDLIIRMHKLLGNRWSLIAGRLPGRTDNEIKNYWNSHLSRRLRKSQETSTVLNKRKRRQKEGVRPPETTIVEAEKVKVHNPKATRIKPLSSFSSSSRVDIPCSDSKECNGGGDHHFSHKIGFLIDDDQDVINGWELEGTSREPMLEKLYDEYLQLLSSEEDDQRQLD